MRLLTVFVAVALLAGAAAAGTIHDIRTGVVPNGSIVEVTGAVVTAVQSNSFTVTEQPAGPFTAIWVYAGSTPTVAEGDVVDIKGLVRDNLGRAEINLLYPMDAGYTVTGTATLPMMYADTLMLQGNYEAYESHVLTITDGMIVQEVLEGGLWMASSVETQLPVVFDDYFYDFATVALGDCYNNAYGMITWHLGQWVFKVMATENVDCTVGNEDLSFSSVKSLFR